AKPLGRITLALLEFDNGTLAFTEPGTKRRASLHLLSSLEGLDPGGIEIFAADLATFAQRLRSENHTLKRALTNPHLFAGIGKPCPVCGAPVQRIVFAENETNYCARCQTGGKILADRALSRLLKKSWPRSLEELE